MTTFDRYLLRRYWHVFGVGFLALFGLYFVIDIFNNLTEFFCDQTKDTRRCSSASPSITPIAPAISSI